MIGLIPCHPTAPPLACRVRKQEVASNYVCGEEPQTACTTDKKPQSTATASQRLQESRISNCLRLAEAGAGRPSDEEPTAEHHAKRLLCGQQRAMKDADKWRQGSLQQQQRQKAATSLCTSTMSVWDMVQCLPITTRGRSSTWAQCCPITAPNISVEFFNLFEACLRCSWDFPADLCTPCTHRCCCHLPIYPSHKLLVQCPLCTTTPRP